MLLIGHDFSDRDGAGLLNAAYVAQVCDILSDAAQRQLVAERVDRLLTELEAATKSRGWRRRAKIGRRKRWYEVPDETAR